jgi:hypothetical protein
MAFAARVQAPRVRRDNSGTNVIGRSGRGRPAGPGRGRRRGGRGALHVQRRAAPPSRPPAVPPMAGRERRRVPAAFLPGRPRAHKPAHARRGGGPAPHRRPQAAPAAPVAAARSRARVVSVSARKAAAAKGQAYICIDCGCAAREGEGPRLPGAAAWGEGVLCRRGGGVCLVRSSSSRARRRPGRADGAAAPPRRPQVDLRRCPGV